MACPSDYVYEILDHNNRKEIKAYLEGLSMYGMKLVIADLVITGEWIENDRRITQNEG